MMNWITVLMVSSKTILRRNRDRHRPQKSLCVVLDHRNIVLTDWALLCFKTYTNTKAYIHLNEVQRWWTGWRTEDELHNAHSGLNRKEHCIDQKGGGQSRQLLQQAWPQMHVGTFACTQSYSMLQCAAGKQMMQAMNSNKILPRLFQRLLQEVLSTPVKKHFFVLVFIFYQGYESRPSLTQNNTLDL